MSTDQVAAFVQLARQASIRAAAEKLFISEQGLRSRLLALEHRLGVELYRKGRGFRRRTPLTREGQIFLPHAMELLDRSVKLCGLFRRAPSVQDIQIVASQYLIAYVLIDAIRRFHRKYPAIRVRLSARTEHDIEEALLDSAEFSFGVAAPYESSPALSYRHLFSMHWSLIVPPRHPLATRKNLKLAHIARYPLVTYERGSTGCQHVAEAFRRLNLRPQVEMEATNTDLIVRMVEARLGVAIVPLLSSGIVTRGRRVIPRSLGRQVRPIDSGILTRTQQEPSEPAAKLLEFLSCHALRL